MKFQEFMKNDNEFDMTISMWKDKKRETNGGGTWIFKESHVITNWFI